MSTWQLNNLRETIALGNNLKLTIVACDDDEATTWRALIEARRVLPHRSETRTTLATQPLESKDADAARDEALRWAREWLGDVVSPLRIGAGGSQEAVLVSDDAVRIDESGDGRWEINDHSEIMTHGMLELHLCKAYSHVDGRMQPAWSFVLMIRTVWNRLSLDNHGIAICPIAQAREQAIQWARAKVAAMNLSFGEG